MPSEVIRALAIVKQACALVNMKLGNLDELRGRLIAEVAEEISQGEWDSQFPLSLWQSGSGTQTNMNMNEVIAGISSSRLGGTVDEKVHPNDHVNQSQSSNDVFPTAMHIAIVHALQERLLPSMRELHKAIRSKAVEFREICKIGRTHTQDATPLTLGHEFSGYAKQIYDNLGRVEAACDALQNLTIGGTAVGTGLNTHHAFAENVVAIIIDITGYKFSIGSNRFALQSAHDDIVSLSAVLNTIAVSLIKIANDLRLLASGPRCGLGEIRLPANEPGSSIMPGKVNPTQCESLTMVCYQVIGNHTTVSMAGSGGILELNACKPVMIYAVLQSIDLLSDGIHSFADKCVSGIRANIDKIDQHVHNSLMLVTALAPRIGYDACRQLADAAYRNNTSIREENIKMNLIDIGLFDELTSPDNMLGPLGKRLPDDDYVSST